MTSPCALSPSKYDPHGCHSCGSPNTRYRSHGLAEDLESVYGRTKALTSEPDGEPATSGAQTDDQTQPQQVKLVLNGTLFGGDRYDGEWSNGKPNGRGVMIYDDGRRYEGEWKDGKRHGKGAFKSANGNEYEGEWFEDKHHGTGRFRWSDGDWHEGSFVEGKIHGAGVRYVPSEGCREEGVWVEDKRNGRFCFYWDDGGEAEAEWDKGVRASGVYRGLDGRVCDLKSFSEKAWYDRTTPTYQIGEFKWQSNTTLGIEYYKGKIERGRMHGKGVLKMFDGSCFDGEFKDDVPFKGIWTQGPSSALTLDDVRRELFNRKFARSSSPSRA